MNLWATYTKVLSSLAAHLCKNSSNSPLLVTHWWISNHKGAHAWRANSFQKPIEFHFFRNFSTNRIIREEIRLFVISFRYQIFWKVFHWKYSHRVYVVDFTGRVNSTEMSHFVITQMRLRNRTSRLEFPVWNLVSDHGVTPHILTHLNRVSYLSLRFWGTYPIKILELLRHSWVTIKRSGFS